MELTREYISKLEQSSLEDILRSVSESFPEKVVFSSSLGQEDQVITDTIFRNQLPVKIFSIDTGRLFNETYELLDKTVARYKQSIQIFFPEAADIEEFIIAKGVNSFYESVDNRKECCHIRKVKPLNRALSGAKVWVTGLRNEQSVNRRNMPLIEWDENKQLYKLNPLINWTHHEVMDYISRYNVPCNQLHEKGFISIGCAPCTRAIEAGEDPRAGRWWWESSQKECGLHLSVKQ